MPVNDFSALDYRDLLDSAPDGMLLVDADGVIRLVNRQAETLFGYPRDELAGQRIELLVPARFVADHPRLRQDYARQPIARTLAAGQGLKARRKDGSEFSAAISLSPIATAAGPAVLTAVRDITDRVSAERDLERRTLEAQLLLCATEVSAVAEDVEDALQGLIDRVCGHTGWPVGHAYLVDQADRDRLIATRLWHTADEGRFAAFRRVTEATSLARGVGLPGRVLEQGELVTWVADGASGQTAAGSQREASDGSATSQADHPATEASPRYAAVREAGIRAAFAFPVKVGEEVAAVLEFFSEHESEPDEGLMQTMANVGRQVGRVFERREAQQAIAEREQQLSTLVHNVPGAIYRYTDSDEGHWIFRYMSDAIENISGYPPGHFIGQPAAVFGSIVHDEDRRKLDEDVREAISRGGSFQSEYRIVHRSGGERWLSAQGTVTHDDVTGCRLVDGVIFDITERKRVEVELREAREAAEQANRAKSTFLANMSHELRTPLNAILGYGEMLIEETEELELADLTADLVKIRHAGTHLLALINDVLDLSKIEAGKTEIFVEEIDVGGLVDEVSATAAPLMVKNDNRIEVQRGERLGVAHQDLTKLRQCLLNLLSNAAKFTHSGVVTLRVDRETRRGEDRLLFEVRDTGIGIAPDKIERLFDEFTQADASTTRKYGGTGLGLAICRRFCRMLGGDITVRSKPCEGSIFSLHIPAELIGRQQRTVVLEETTAGSTEDLETLRRVGAGRTVLVIDDDPEARDIVRRFLEKEGFQVVCAGTGEEGLRLAHEVVPAAVTLDVMMPDMDGWTVLRAFKADPHLRDIPVIMLTMVDDKSKGYSLGANDYLTKPIDRNRLLETLERYRCEAGPCTVLVVEDEPDTARMMVRMLERSGWSARAAGNGREALDAIAAEMPGLVLLDLMMPVMDGFEFLLALRAHSEWRDLPVIVVTAKELTEEDRRQLSGKVEEVLQKGAYTREQLIGMVRGLINERAPEAALMASSGRQKED